MKFAFKSLVTVAAFVAVGAASAADWTYVAGTGSLVFSAPGLNALSSSGSNVITAGTVNAGLPGAGAVNSAKYTKATGTVALTFSSAVINGDTLTSLSAANSVVNIRRSIVDDNDQITAQYNVYLANFNVNLGNSTIYADFYSSTGVGSTNLTNHGNLAIYTASLPGVVGGTQGQIVADSATTGHASGSLNGDLKFNNDTATLVLTSLGLETTGDIANLVRNSNWGATSASGTFSAVPEPSTYALMGAGLLAMGAMVRRRKSA